MRIRHMTDSEYYNDLTPESENCIALIEYPYISSLRYCLSGKAPHHYSVAINIFKDPYKTIYYVSTCENNEESISYIMDNHSELFEWLLFHPEWL